MLFVDDREGSAELIPLLGSLAYPFHGEGSTADVLCYGNGPSGELLVQVEVKTVEDLLSSETTGRLAGTQFPQMLKDSGPAYLLTIGRYRVGAGGQLEVHKIVRRRNQWTDGWFPYLVGSRAVPYAYVEGFLVEAQEIGVRLKQVADVREAACWLISMHNWWAKPWDKHRAMRRLDESRDVGLMPDLDPVTKQMLKFARQVPGFGYEKAEAAAYHFESGVQMACASTQEWEKVAGVGRVLAKQAVEAWRRTRG